MTLENRIHRLEKRNRVLTALVSLGVIGLVVLGTIAADAPGRKRGNVIRATRFELVDNKGNVLAKLAAPEGERPGLRVYAKDGTLRAMLNEFGFSLLAKNGNLRVGLSASDKRSGLVFYTNGGKPSITLMADADGKPLLSLMDAKRHAEASIGVYDAGNVELSMLKKGKDRITLALDKDGGPDFLLSNAQGNELVRLTSTVDGKEGVVNTYNDKGKTLVVLTAMTDGEGMVSTYNGKGKKLVSLHANAEGGGVVNIYNDKGKELVNLTASVDGKGMVNTYNEKGKRMITLTASDDGGFLSVWNKAGEGVIQLRTDNDGNGVVGAYNRKGKGRTLESK